MVMVRSADGLEQIAYDALVLSPGASAFVPPIPGVDSPRVRTLRTVEDALALRDRVTAGARRAVVLGAGFIGIEAAEALAAQGLDVSVVELAPQPLPPVEPELAWLVSEELRATRNRCASRSRGDVDPSRTGCRHRGARRRHGLRQT